MRGQQVKRIITCLPGGRHREINAMRGEFAEIAAGHPLSQRGARQRSGNRVLCHTDQAWSSTTNAGTNAALPARLQ